jgi:cytochrome c-type biogenesis protein CcmH/NrfF
LCILNSFEKRENLTNLILVSKRISNDVGEYARVAPPPSARTLQLVLFSKYKFIYTDVFVFFFRLKKANQNVEQLDEESERRIGGGSLLAITAVNF